MQFPAQGWFLGRAPRSAHAGLAQHRWGPREGAAGGGCEPALSHHARPARGGGGGGRVVLAASLRAPAAGQEHLPPWRPVTLPVRYVGSVQGSASRFPFHCRYCRPGICIARHRNASEHFQEESGGCCFSFYRQQRHVRVLVRGAVVSPRVTASGKVLQN